MVLTIDQALRNAATAAQSGHMVMAEQLYRAILEKDPANKGAQDGLTMLLATVRDIPPQEEMRAIIALFAQGQLNHALARAIALSSRYPHSVTLQNLTGAIFVGLGRNQDAIASFSKALHLKPDYADAYYNRGLAMKALKRLNEAVGDFDRALEFQPGVAEAHNNRGQVLHELRRLEEALISFNEALQVKPGYVDAYNNRGNLLQDMGRLSEAVSSYDNVLQINPAHADAFYNRGIALQSLNRLVEAVASYDKALAVNPGYVAAYNNRGLVLRELKRLGEAVESFDKALQISPGDPNIHYNRGLALRDMKQLDEAIRGFDRALQIAPDFAGAHNDRGIALQAKADLKKALASFDRAIQLQPLFVDAYNNRGNVLREMKRPDEALASFESALRLKPDYADAWNKHGIVLTDLGRLGDALASFCEAIRLNPQNADFHVHHGNVLLKLRRLSEALASYENALRVESRNANANYNRGVALRELRRLDEASASLGVALQTKSDYVDAHYLLGVVLYDMKRFDEALESFNNALRIDPEHVLALEQILHLKAHMCDWTPAAFGDDLRFLGVTGAAVSPFSLLAFDDNSEHHLKRSQAWALENYTNKENVAAKASARKTRLRIGYFSSDFHNHATMYLMARLFELHDKSRFEIHAFSYDDASNDEMRLRLLGAVEVFHDVRDLSDENVALLSRNSGIDIAVDLKGYTRDNRAGIFSYRAAPVQINYLGYPGTMGAGFIDYIIADKIVIPESAQQFYSEKVLYLPVCYQANDNNRATSGREFSRSELGLPEDGFVFCCFNNSYKISSAEFDIWMRLLQQVKGSVLWLFKSNRWAEANLRKEAAARGVSPDRLVFAEQMPHAEHLARLQSADLFLDTFTYNAHTTASDALWAGVPVLTKLGEGFAARVAGSLLHAIGLPELVTDNINAYEELALLLAQNPDRLADVRSRLAANKASTPLFDSERFTRDIESAYELAFNRYASGLEPSMLIVERPAT